MNKLWYDKIRNIEPYIPGEQPENKNIIKLNTNESPFPPSERVKKVFKEFNTDNLRLYPSFKCESLKEIICNKYNLKENQLFIGNGSDEVLAFCFMAFFNSDKNILFPDITYSFYDVWCNLFNINYKKIPVNSNFEIDEKDYFIQNGGIVIANPNAPTGLYMELDKIEQIIQKNRDVIILIDEAYIDFGSKSSLELINKYDNIVVIHTFSKSRCLAGIRIGYAMANEELINILESVKNSFNSYTINSVSQIAAAECAKDIEYFEICINKIINEREKTIKRLDKLGFKTLPSKTNFIFTTNPNLNIKELFDYLKSKNIIVRYFNKERINQYLRITIGTNEQMNILIEEIENFLNLH